MRTTGSATATRACRCSRRSSPSWKRTIRPDELTVEDCMRMRMTAAAAILVAAALGGASASADPAPVAVPSGPPPLSAYGRLPLIEDIQISPDGALIAVIVTDGEDRALIIKQSSGGKIIGGLKAG